MRFVGIDAGKKHWVCVLDENRKEVIPKFTVKNTLADFALLVERIGEDAKVCIEDTGAYSKAISTYLRNNGYDVLTISGHRSKSLREYIRLQWKTDPADAETLALVRLLEGVIPVSDTVNHKRRRSSALRSLGRLYVAAVKRQSQYKQRIISLLQEYYPELTDEFTRAASLTILGVLRWTQPADWASPVKVCDILKQNGISAQLSTVKRVLSCIRDSSGVVLEDDCELVVLIVGILYECGVLFFGGTFRHNYLELSVGVSLLCFFPQLSEHLVPFSSPVRVYFSSDDLRGLAFCWGWPGPISSC